MGFTSNLYPNEVIIDESTPEGDTLSPTMSRGLELPRGHSAEDYNYGGSAEPFPVELEIPESEWADRIQEREKRQSRISDRIVQTGHPEKDQNGVPYCWIFGPVQAYEFVRMMANEPYISFSPASAGAPIKNFRSVGGWGKEGLEWIAKYGLVPTANWPDYAVNRKYYTEENKSLALKYRVTEWWELRPRSVKQLVSCLLLGWPVAVGYNWWAHEVVGVDPLWLDGAIALRIRNQWKGWGDKNFGVLRGNKMIPDDAVVPRVTMSGGKIVAASAADINIANAV